MKNIYIILILMCFQSLSWGQKSSTPDQSSPLSPEQLTAAETEYNLWFNQLNESLLSSTDSYTMTMGLTAMLNGSLSSLRTQPDNQEIQAMLAKQITLLNSIIQQNNLSDATLELLISWCFKEAIVTRCDQNTLLDKQLKQTPDNLNVYLMPLQLAIDTNNQPLTDKIITLMSQSKLSHTTKFITAAFNQTIDSYIQGNPVPDSAIAAFKDDQALLSGVSDTIKANLDQHIRDYFPASIKMSYVYLFDPPETKPLYETCKSRPDLFEPCLAITQILINASNAIQFKGLGYVILMSMHEKMGKTKLLKTVQVKQERYKTTIQCLSNASKSSNFMDNFLDPKYQQINLLPIDEIKKLDLMATYVYQKNKVTNPKHRNPVDCYPASL